MNRINRTSLWKRLDRLECQRTETGNRLPPDFWDALAGKVPFDEMTPETLLFLERCYEPVEIVDPLDEALRLAGMQSDEERVEQIVRELLPFGVQSPCASPPN